MAKGLRYIKSRCTLYEATAMYVLKYIMGAGSELATWNITKFTYSVAIAMSNCAQYWHLLYVMMKLYTIHGSDIYIKMELLIIISYTYSNKSIYIATVHSVGV